MKVLLETAEWWYVYDLTSGDGCDAEDLTEVPDELVQDYRAALGTFIDIQRKIATAVGNNDFRMPGWCWTTDPPRHADDAG